MTTAYKTLLLDTDAWDLVLDAAGNIAVAEAPYSVAQDVASYVKSFRGECWYDSSLGIPHFEKVLGHFPPVQYVRDLISDAAAEVPSVKSASVTSLNIVNRQLIGNIEITDADGNVYISTFAPT